VPYGAKVGSIPTPTRAQGKTSGAHAEKLPPSTAASGNMRDMKTSLALLGLALCALPLLAEQPARRVVAPCELTMSSLTPAGGQSPKKDREFVVMVVNESPRTLAIPRTPVFGWRVDVQTGKVAHSWKLKAQGGPVRRISVTDPHVLVTAPSGAEPMVEVLPTHSASFIADLPEAAAAFHPSRRGNSSMRLTLYWAASADLAKRVPDVPVCGLAPELTVNALLP